MAQQAPRVSFSDKDLENGAPNNDRAASRKWSTAPGNIEDLDEYTALQKYISTYRDPKAAAIDDAEGQNKDAADAGKGKAWWQFWRSGSSPNAKGSDAGVVPEEWLDADIKQGISNHDVESRRKRFGWNEISSEKENLFIKFLSFFTGPILYSKSIYIPFPSHGKAEAATNNSHRLQRAASFRALGLRACFMPHARQACPRNLSAVKLRTGQKQFWQQPANTSA